MLSTNAANCLSLSVLSKKVARSWSCGKMSRILSTRPCRPLSGSRVVVLLPSSLAFDVVASGGQKSSIESRKKAAFPFTPQKLRPDIRNHVYAPLDAAKSSTPGFAASARDWTTLRTSKPVALRYRINATTSGSCKICRLMSEK